MCVCVGGGGRTKNLRGCKSSVNALMVKWLLGRNTNSATGSITCMVGQLGDLETVASDWVKRCLKM